MNNEIPFVFCNQIYYIGAETDMLTLSRPDGTVLFKENYHKLEDSHDIFIQLAMAVYRALF